MRAATAAAGAIAAGLPVNEGCAPCVLQSRHSKKLVFDADIVE